MPHNHGIPYLVKQDHTLVRSPAFDFHPRKPRVHAYAIHVYSLQRKRRKKEKKLALSTNAHAPSMFHDRKRPDQTRPSSRPLHQRRSTGSSSTIHIPQLHQLFNHAIQLLGLLQPHNAFVQVRDLFLPARLAIIAFCVCFFTIVVDVDVVKRARIRRQRREGVVGDTHGRTGGWEAKGEGGRERGWGQAGGA